jgi:YD repeat-containing protein
MDLPAGVSISTYTHAGTGYGNRDAVTTTYGYDYANRLISLSTGGASTTYGYDAFGARVYQIIPSTSTSTYPFKFFSIASTTKSSMHGVWD